MSRDVERLRYHRCLGFDGVDVNHIVAHSRFVLLT